VKNDKKVFAIQLVIDWKKNITVIRATGKKRNFRLPVLPLIVNNCRRLSMLGNRLNRNRQNFFFFL
jgi:hypothetical protein